MLSLLTLSGAILLLSVKSIEDDLNHWTNLPLSLTLKVQQPNQQNLKIHNNSM